MKVEIIIMIIIIIIITIIIIIIMREFIHIKISFKKMRLMGLKFTFKKI